MKGLERRNIWLAMGMICIENPVFTAQYARRAVYRSLFGRGRGGGGGGGGAGLQVFFWREIQIFK